MDESRQERIHRLRRKRRIELFTKRIVVFICLPLLAVGLIVLSINKRSNDNEITPGETDFIVEMPETSTNNDDESTQITQLTEEMTTEKMTENITTTVPNELTTEAKTQVSSGSASGYVQKNRNDSYLLLINQYNILQNGEVPELASTVGGYQLAKEAAQAMRDMINAAGSKNLYLVSAYRSISSQTTLFNNKTQQYKDGVRSQEEAEALAAMTVARPGQSEHNAGLAADVLGSGYSTLTTGFANTSAYEWLIANCAEYGFIERYPNGKTDITGVNWEPWHFRYVGKEHAKAIMSRGVTLEEYIQELETGT